ncbi:23162_t:CDS:2 [Gigaspora margarita]|uniref:23162_t:CDS:1 n=1 Tax=Gigaspora margarita TaxID=4874 RepID=A0ABN7UKX4_GIGMA|nr:23162_t:CDS:2 [Gigaspora margarita]
MMISRKSRKNSKSISSNSKNKKKLTSPKVINQEITPITTVTTLVESPKPITPIEEDPPNDLPIPVDVPIKEIEQNLSPILTTPKIEKLSPIIPRQTLSKSINDGLSLISKPISMIDIPLEIFSYICAYLPPDDLLSLVLVCQTFRRLLCNPVSPITQSIWRTSRENFLPHLQLPPPPSMDEKEYIVLRQLRKGCQFCQERETGFVKVYWQFRVRCCEMCLDERTTRRDTLYINWCVPDEVLSTLPFIFRGASQVYWTKDVIATMHEYSNISDDDLLIWLDQRRTIANNIMNVAPDYEREENDELQSNLMFTNQIINPVSINPMLLSNSVQQIPSQLNRFQYLVPPQFNTPIPYNRSHFMFTPHQQFYSQFFPRINRQPITHYPIGLIPQSRLL